MKVLYKFEVPGDPRGYTTTTHRDKGRSSRYKKYKEYCRLVREYAAMAGVPIPLTADKDNQLMIKTFAYFRNGVHCDPENVRKGVVDAIFYDPLNKTKSNGDKWTAGFFCGPRYDAEEPRVVVIIKEYESK